LTFCLTWATLKGNVRILRDFPWREVIVDTGQLIAIALSILLGVWFVVAGVFNRRHGVRVFRWLQQGLSTWGKIGEARWIGSSGSGARLTISQGNKPFGRVEAVFLLESREIAPLWAFNRLRGKRDEMILKANLRTAPPLEIEAAPPEARHWREVIGFREVGAVGGLRVTMKGHEKPAFQQRVDDFLRAYSDSLLRFSLRRRSPHLIVHVQLPSLLEKPPEELFQALAALLS